MCRQVARDGCYLWLNGIVNASEVDDQERIIPADEDFHLAGTQMALTSIIVTKINFIAIRTASTRLIDNYSNRVVTDHQTISKAVQLLLQGSGEVCRVFIIRHDP